MHDDLLAHALSALASPMRLQILRSLRTPRALGEIHVRAPEDGRIIARQTVREHLNRLIQAGMVVTREVDRSYGDAVEFVANHQTIYALAEEMRGLSRVRPAVEPEAVTVHASGANHAATADAKGPSLVMVKGLEEGTSFSLQPPVSGIDAREWLVGRRRGIAVALDFDPYVSSENSRITWRDGTHFIEDIPGSRNGTSVNFHLLSPGQRHALRHGDVIGVGRCILVFWSR